MWIIGLVVGAMLGGATHGFNGAMWGALIGWLIGTLLARTSGSAAQSAREIDFDAQERFDKRIAHVQKAVEDIHWRLKRLEEKSGVEVVSGVAATPSPSVAPAESATIAAAPFPAARIEPPLPTIPPQNESGQNFVPPQVFAATPDPSTRDAASIETPIKAAEYVTTATSTVTPVGLIERLLEGNIVAKLGVVILFFGVGFLLKFAYDRGMFPPELRLLGVAVASAVMFFLGARLLQRERTYALILFGGASGLLYLDVFFALKTFALISAPFGFLLFALLGVATIMLAVKLDARAFAALGLLGAFMAPVLASTRSGNHVLLFSYYLLLNLIVFGASWFKAWRELNFIGFLFTFAIALIWGYASYQPENFSTVEPFLIAFFLLYLAIPILFAQRQPPQLRGVVDGTLVFGMPLSAAMLQAALTRGMGDSVLAWSAFGAALIYVTLAWALWRREKMRLLAEAHLALAIVFATATPYFALQGYPTFAFWTLEGAAIFWMGCRQKSVLARVFALCLQIGAAGYFWSVTTGANYLQPWWNDRVIGCTLIAAASVLTAWFMHRFQESISALEKSLQGLALAWGTLWLFLGFCFGAWQQWSVDASRLSAVLIFAAVVFVAFEWLGTRLDWCQMRLTARAHVLMIAAVAFAWNAIGDARHPLVDGGVLAWPLSFIAYFYVLHRQRRDEIESRDGWRDVSAWLLMLTLATWEVLWRYWHEQYAWVLAISAVGFVAAALRFRLREFSAETKDAGTSSAPLSHVPLAWALLWWVAGLYVAIEMHTRSVHHLALYLSAAALSILIFEVAGRVLAWTALRRTQVLLTLAMLVAALKLADTNVNPFAGAQLFAWLLAFIVSGMVLAIQERDHKAWRPAWQHVVLFNLALLLLAWELYWRAEHAALSLAWQYAGVGATIAAGLAMTTIGIRKNVWPCGEHATAFRAWSVIPMLAVALLWTMVANVSSNGTVLPLPYLPILNPLDLAQLAVFAAAVWATKNLIGIVGANKNTALLILAGAGFFWVNAALLRTVHQWADVPFELSALLHSVVAQAALSLLWTTTALVIMCYGRKKIPPSRAMWMTGAALLGVVVVKLFANDLGNTGTVARIVSFIGVGVLLLVIGYVAPMPPKYLAQVQENK